MSNLPLPVQAVIAQENLATVLWIGAEPIQADITFATLDAVMDAAFQSRFDLVFVDGSCFQTDKAQLVSLIAKARDLLSSRILVEWAPDNCPNWQETDFLALAMRRRAETETAGVRRIYYSYDLKTYKQVPDWLNPKYWANPHMWDKARW